MVVRGVNREDIMALTKEQYKYWANSLLEKIENIAERQYPDMPYWIDTGSRLDAAMAMLNRFDEDLSKKWWQRIFD